MVGGAARFAVVDVLARIREADAREAGGFGYFGREERRLFEREVLYQVVIGMGRLDVSEGEPENWEEEEGDEESESEMYEEGSEEEQRFPVLTSPFQATAPIPFRTRSPTETGTLRRSPGSVSPISSTLASSSSPPRSPHIHVPSIYSANPHTPSPPSQIQETEPLPPEMLPPAPRPRHATIASPIPQPAVHEPPPEAEGSGSEEVEEEEEEVDAGEQAAVGRLSSMSLMAAVTASANGELFPSKYVPSLHHRTAL
jgi:serine/threonine-protein phosphatase 4 regulatory subunit 1